MHDGVSRIGQGLRQFWRRSKSSLLIALLAFAVLGLIASAWLLFRDAANNRTIAALNSGRDEPIGADAPAPVLFARLQFLLLHDRADEAQGLMDLLGGTGDRALIAQARYNLGNSRMRRAFDLLQSGKLDAAGPLINLAREDYRRALGLAPDLWDARYNLDVAMRLIRDYPGFELKGDEMRAGEKAIWTDIPGIPRGEP